MTKEQSDILSIAEDEEIRWKNVHAAIVDEMNRAHRDMHNDRKVARALTAEMVNAGQDEDKVALASDEAVAHKLTALRKDIKENFDELAKQPYFARVVTDEDGKKVEFRLGTTSFPSQRIVDWRKGPISQLYYSYKEGDEFSEVIQGKDREGVIKLRRSYQGYEDNLNVIELPKGAIRKENDEWIYDSSHEPLSRSNSKDGHLPPILSLITQEQFDLITRNAVSPVVIQGIAGSGKTTVALHRLAWLLHEDNSNAKPENCLVVVFNRSLKAYIDTTLPELGIDGVNIRTYHQWLNGLLNDIAGERPYGSFKRYRTAEQFKSSEFCLDEIINYVRDNPEKKQNNYVQDVFNFYKYICKKNINWPAWNDVKNQLNDQVQSSVWDYQDDTVLLNLVYAREGSYPFKNSLSLGRCDHIVIDEAQDFGIMEIRALLNALDMDRTITIVGDASQKIVMNRYFGGWERILKEAGFAESTPIELTVSHRTTREIMEIAAEVRGDGSIDEKQIKTTRHGPMPNIIKTDSYELQLQKIATWVEDCVKENQYALSAIICRQPRQAERLVDDLRMSGHPYVRWGHREKFDFSPGVIVTNVHQVKGLEFRNVLIVDPTEEQYSMDNEEEKNLLYVAITRAEVRLDFIVRGQISYMLARLDKELRDPFEDLISNSNVENSDAGNVSEFGEPEREDTVDLETEDSFEDESDILDEL